MTTNRVVLLHGLWMPRLSMHWLAQRLREAGFAPEFFGYATVGGGPDAAIPRLAGLLQRSPAHVVAHSLGGLVTLRTLDRHPSVLAERVVCLGSPLCGSAAASGLAGYAWTAPTLGRSASLLREGCSPWTGKAEVGVVAGRTSLGLGKYFGRFQEENDGTVAVAETRLQGLADHTVVSSSHTGLVYSREVAGLVAGFLHSGHFGR
ncbi:MAG TPA: alpha/beta hydrolase [Lysobacter sp.]